MEMHSARALPGTWSSFVRTLAHEGLRKSHSSIKECGEEGATRRVSVENGSDYVKEKEGAKEGART